MTQYLVCPHCRTVTPIAPERMIGEAAYNTWVFVKLTPGRIDLHGAALELDVSYMTVHRHLNMLADVGLVKRVPQGNKYAKRQRHWYEVEAAPSGTEHSQEGRDPNVTGEAESDRAVTSALVSAGSTRGSAQPHFPQ